MKRYIIFFMLFYFTINTMETDEKLIKVFGACYNITKLDQHALSFDEYLQPKINNYQICIIDHKSINKSLREYPLCGAIFAHMIMLESNDQLIQVTIKKHKDSKKTTNYYINTNYVTATMDEQFLMAIKLD